MRKNQARASPGIFLSLELSPLPLALVNQPQVPKVQLAVIACKVTIQTRRTINRLMA